MLEGSGVVAAVGSGAGVDGARETADSEGKSS